MMEVRRKNKKKSKIKLAIIATVITSFIPFMLVLFILQFATGDGGSSGLQQIVTFTVPTEILNESYRLCEPHEGALDWIELVTYGFLKCGNDVDSAKLQEGYNLLSAGYSIVHDAEKECSNMFHNVLNGIVGHYEVQVEKEVVTDMTQTNVLQNVTQQLLEVYDSNYNSLGYYYWNIDEIGVLGSLGFSYRYVTEPEVRYENNIYYYHARIRLPVPPYSKEGWFTQEEINGHVYSGNTVEYYEEYSRHVASSVVQYNINITGTRTLNGVWFNEDALGLLALNGMSYTENKVVETQIVTEIRWGKKSYFPIAKGYTYTHAKDFGDSRNYGSIRNHEGNDIMAATGTPIISVEDGYIENIGWNDAGGYRIGIRSTDGNRYFYYAHMERFAPGMAYGTFVSAGDVIGYVGDTGYGPQGTAGKFEPHLHFGIQVKNNNTDIWIDPSSILEFLEDKKMEVVQDGNDFRRAE